MKAKFLEDGSLRTSFEIHEIFCTNLKKTTMTQN